MTMKIWHQSFAQLDALPVYRAALEKHLREAAAPGTEVVLHGMDPRTKPAFEVGKKDIAYPYFQFLHANQFLDNVMQAEKEGYDAFLMSTFPDPYLDVARTLVDIPVIGFGFSAMHTAAYLGRRFGIICFLKDLMPHYVENVRKYGLENLGGPIRHIGLAYADIHKGFEDPRPVVDAFTRVARELIESEGVDVLLPGEGPLGLLLHTNGIHRIDEVPIMDGFVNTLKAAEMMVQLRRTSGLSVTRAGFFHNRPPQQRIDELQRFYFRK
ncbi:MAG TPA: aspartate/glutamate racemase family protein [Roseomonas sp.]|nr:aspartate/glutamate racemase family protein [Roseomonas sp.]